MRPYILLGLLALCITEVAALANDKDETSLGENRADLVQRIQKACRKQLSQPDPDAPSWPRNPARTCRCVSSNLDHKLSYEELELLTRSHEGEARAGRELQKEKYFDLIDYDGLVVHSCMKDSEWTYDPHKTEPTEE